MKGRYKPADSVKSKNLDKKLLAYSAMAGVVLSAARQGLAQIDYTDVDPDEVLNDNGEKFYIQFEGQNKFYIEFITSNYSTLYRYAAIYPNTAAASFIGSSFSAFALPANYIISEGRPFTSSAWFANLASWSSGGRSSGQFLGQSNKYIGLKFTDLYGAHYGWCHIVIPSNLSSVTITGYAYEQTPGLGIRAGETDQSLSAQLSSFTAAQQNNAVLLNWTTQSEVENAGFILERRLLDKNGAPQETWRQIASFETHPALQGQGTVSCKTDYQFTDEQITPGAAYEYRLSDVDLQGRINIYKVIRITLDELPGEFALLQNYPNPFNPKTTFPFQVAERTHVTIRIYNLKGQTVSTLIDEITDPGFHEVSWNGSSFPSGVYFCEMQTADFRQIRKLNLLK